MIKMKHKKNPGRRTTIAETMRGGRSNAEITDERLRERAEELKRRRSGVQRLGAE